MVGLVNATMGTNFTAVKITEHHVSLLLRFDHLGYMLLSIFSSSTNVEELSVYRRRAVLELTEEQHFWDFEPMQRQEICPNYQAQAVSTMHNCCDHTIQHF